MEETPSTQIQVKANALFERFAQNHGFDYQIEDEALMDILWTFPAQSRLPFALTLGLQNGDELNFGVEDFWSYFFPFDKVAEQFENLLDAWISGEARIAMFTAETGQLQIRKQNKWETVYRANPNFAFWRKPIRYIQIEPSY